MKILRPFTRYIKNYRSRHRNNLNLILHLIGVPETVIGLVQLLTGRWRMGIFNIFFGFFLQWFGHNFIEHNEMGELVGIKKVLSKIKGT